MHPTSCGLQAAVSTLRLRRCDFTPRNSRSKFEPCGSLHEAHATRAKGGEFVIHPPNRGGAAVVLREVVLRLLQVHCYIDFFTYGFIHCDTRCGTFAKESSGSPTLREWTYGIWDVLLAHVTQLANGLATWPLM